MLSKMRIILVRHGRTLANDEGVFQGDEDELSKEGKEQIKKVALRLKDEKIDYIYSSPIKRAADTARAIAKFHPNIKIIFENELREGDVDKRFFGKPYSAIADWNSPPRGVESNEDVNKRAKQLIDKIYKKHKKDCVLFVGHNGINRSLIQAITEQPRVDIKQYNTAVSIFEINEDKTHHIHCLNCTKHLE